MSQTGSSIKKLATFFRFAPEERDYGHNYMLRSVVMRQFKAAKRIPPIWLWRSVEEREEHSTVYRETTTSSWAEEPVVARILVKSATFNKALKKAGFVIEEHDHDLTIDLAEAIRLGELFDTVDESLDMHFYIPRSGDVYQWNGAIYEMEDFKCKNPDGFFSPIGRYVVWEGKGSLYNGTASNLFPVKAEEPEVEAPIWPA